MSLPLRRDPDFLKLWAAQAVSQSGSFVTRTALPLTAILLLGATPFQMGLLYAADLAPGIALGLVAGVWADRVRRRPILIAADLGRALLLATVPLAALAGRLTMAHLFAVALGAGALTVGFDVACAAYVPGLAGRERLVDANRAIAASGSAAQVAGFSGGGALVQVLGAPFAILADAASFVVSALLVALIRRPEPPPAPPPAVPDFRREVAEGFRHVLSDRVLLRATGAALALGSGTAVCGAAYLLFVGRELALPPSVLGLVFAVGGVSSLGGALVARKALAVLGDRRAMALSLVLCGAGGLLVPLAPGATLLAVCLLVAQQLVQDPAWIVFDIASTTLRQRHAPDALLGRVQGSVRFAVLAATLAGSLAGGLLGGAIGLRGTLVAGNLLIAAGALCLARAGPEEDGGPVSASPVHVPVDSARSSG